MSQYLFLLALALFFLGVISAQQQLDSDLTVSAANDDLQPKIEEWYRKQKKSDRFARQQHDNDEVYINYKALLPKYKKNREKKAKKSNSDESWFDNINLGCTIECTSYWRCKGDQIWKGPSTQCEKPAGCQCDKFAWQQDDDDDDEGRIADWFKSLADKLKKRKSTTKRKQTSEDDDAWFWKDAIQKAFPNGFGAVLPRSGGPKRNMKEKTTDEDEGWFDNINLACTVECTSYWRCKGDQIWKGPSTQCEKPAGCQCDKFAWQQDDDDNDAIALWRSAGRMKLRK